MNDGTVEKVALGVFITCFGVALVGVGTIGWGFVELIQWVTSK